MASGMAIQKKDTESNFGKTEQNTKAFGKTTRQMAKAHFIIWMEINTTVTGLMTKLMGTAGIHIQTVILMKVSGKMMCKMEKEKKLGSMVPSFKEIIKWVRNTALAIINGLTNPNIKAIGKWGAFLEKDSIPGLTGDLMMAIGKKIACMGKELMSGRMEDHIVVIT